MMNMKKLTLIVTAATAMTIALPSFAGRFQHDDDKHDDYTGTNRHYGSDRDYERRSSERGFQRDLDKRQARQWHRIEDGVDAGELTRKETKRLKRQQRKIARLEDEFCSDHHYSRKERHILKRKLDKASDSIYHKKHNDRRLYERYSAGLWKPVGDSHSDRGRERWMDDTSVHGLGRLFWR